LMPITGITLPFVSAGGSSLLSYVPALAVLFAMSSTIKRKRTY
jgi:rod shape determining protein RodA